jgi:HEAT repeat protein
MPARDGADRRTAVERAADAAALGMRARLPAGAAADLERAASDDPDARVRAAALGALARAAGRRRATAAWRVALADANPAVRRSATDPTPGLDAPARPLLALLGDDDVTVLEASAWALGELGAAAVRAGAVPALVTVARAHDDPLAREAAVAAIGALGDPAGLPAVLAACRDKPAVRRRAVLALAPFDGAEVDEALRAALEDRDWQVRQAAEDLLAE